jgi:ABC-type multidrug transport system ATPase subunit
MSGIVILSASVGLGTYTPAVQLYRYLCAQKRPVSIEVLERLFSPEKISHFKAARLRFQNDFRFALAARKTLSLHSPADCVDIDKRSVLLNRWKQAGETRFIVFSGFWLPLLKEYQESIGTEIAVDCVQMEVVLSPSWRAHLKDYPLPIRLIWFYSSSQGGVLQTLLPVSAIPGRRKRGLVLHGGGWQLGDYDSPVPALAGAGYSLLVGRSQDQPCVPHAVAELCELMSVNELLGVPVRQLSLGERMKFELIAALVHEPRVMFLDEPTIGLDILAQKRILEFLKHVNQARKTTILLTSHNLMDIQKLCSRVMIINRGRLVSDGRLADLCQVLEQKKIIRIETSQPMLIEDLQRLGEVREFDTYRARVEVSREAVRECAALLCARQAITDINIEDIPLEENLERIFAQEALKVA